MRSEDSQALEPRLRQGGDRNCGLSLIDFICPIRTLGFISLSAPKEISLILFSAELIVITRPVSQPGSVEIAREES